MKLPPKVHEDLNWQLALDAAYDRRDPQPLLDLLSRRHVPKRWRRHLADLFARRFGNSKRGHPTKPTWKMSTLEEAHLRVRELIRTRGWSQAQAIADVAEYLDLDPTTLTNHCAGKTGYARKLKKLHCAGKTGYARKLKKRSAR